MRKILLFFFTSAILLACSDTPKDSRISTSATDPGKGSAAIKDTSKKSIPRTVSKWVGNTDITISYHSPGVRGRTIWGGLVPYNEIWVTGAHKATSIEIGKSFRAGDKDIPAGKYALFTIPGKDEWIIVINKNWSQHLTDDYSEAEDVARIKVKPEVTRDTTERLTYEIDQQGERLADIIISWEKLRVVLPLEI
ncbi:MAG TPA: DUF2911 domain-containing protein [Flavisolibacter sp.]|nr:DUF2911 domain-containing protein [Flavisolibacter sp.]